MGSVKYDMVNPDLIILGNDQGKITKEIEDGPTASNSSGTLGGIGNLFEPVIY